MIEDALSTLSANPPPRAVLCTADFRKRFENSAEALLYLNMLEVEMGQPKSPNGTSFVAICEKIRAAESAVVARDKAAQATAPAAAANKSGAGILQEYAAIAHPQDRVEFYRKNKSQIDKAYREEPAPAAATQPTGIKILDLLNSIQDPRERVSFYRNNKQAIDSAYKTSK